MGQVINSLQQQLQPKNFKNEILKFLFNCINFCIYVNL